MNEKKTVKTFFRCPLIRVQGTYYKMIEKLEYNNQLGYYMNNNDSDDSGEDDNEIMEHYRILDICALCGDPTKHYTQTMDIMMSMKKYKNFIKNVLDKKCDICNKNLFDSKCIIVSHTNETVI